MTRSLRLALVLLLTSSILVVVPGAVTATVPGAIDDIVFSSTADHAFSEIYSRPFAGTSPQRLTFNAVQDYDPKYSPDGTRILFNRSPQMGVIDIVVMASDGTGEVVLTAGSSAVNVALDWSPDGSQVLFASDGNLWLMRPDGSDWRQLTNNAFEEWEGSWSPDGSTIAVNREGELFLVAVDGSAESPLLLREEADSDPVWSPDGARIAFVSRQSSYNNIWIMNADGSQPYSLTNTVMSDNREPAWAPDGSKIAFSSNRDGDWDIWMMNPDGTDLGHLTNNPADERFVDWESQNRDPVAVNDRVDSKRGREVVISPLANDSDPDGGLIVISDVTRMPAEGTVVIDGDNLIYAHSGAMPPIGHGYPYEDTFEYEIQDERLGAARATVSVWLFPSFDDVPEPSLFAAEIEWLALQEITRGCNPPDNTMFCPGDFVTRAQMAAFLVRSQSYGVGAGDDLFVDDNGSVFELDIDKLGTAGVTRGCNPPRNDRFCPDGFVTRGQMAAFLVRAYQLPASATGDLFTDDDGSVFEDDIDRLGASGVTRGCNPPVNDRYCPDDLVTREQMAAFLFRVGPPAG